MDSKQRRIERLSSVSGRTLRIAFTGQPEYYRCLYENDLDELFTVREFRMAWGAGASHYDELVRFDPDVAFFFRPERYPDEVLQAIGGVTVALSSEPIPKHFMGHFVSSHDMDGRFESLCGARNRYDFFFHYDKTSIRFLRQNGFDVSGEFLFPVATGMYRPLDVEKFWDWGFFGRDTAYRESYLGVAKRDFEGLHVAHGIYGREFVRLMNTCRIGINLHVDPQVSLEHRMHNMMACGVMVMSDPLSHNDLLKPGHHYVEFSEPQEFWDKLKYYLEHESERRRIAENGYRLICQKLSAKGAFTRLVTFLSGGSEPGRIFMSSTAGSEQPDVVAEVSLARLRRALPNLSTLFSEDYLVLDGWRNFRDRLFPHFTLRRRVYEALVRFIKRLLRMESKSLAECVVRASRRVKNLLFPPLSLRRKIIRHLVPMRSKLRRKRISEVFTDSARKHGLSADAPTMVIILPSQGISGGTMVLCEHAHRLMNAGYNVVFVDTVLGGVQFSLDWFPKPLPDVVNFRMIGFDQPVDFAMATHWTTALLVGDFPARRRLYFVQSDETRFSKPGTLDWLLTRDTYAQPFEYIVIAKWLQAWLWKEFGQESRYVPYGLDPELFWPDKPLEPKGKKLRVLLEGAISYPFKGMKEAFEVVHDVDCEVWCVSSDGRPKPGWKYDRFFHQVPFGQMRRIYSSCDVLIKMSKMEGFFLPPLEMMACGGTVITNKVSGYDEYIVDGVNGLVVEAGDCAAARERLLTLIHDRELLERLKKAGPETAKQWRWERSGEVMRDVLSGHPLAKTESLSPNHLCDGPA